ncbi:MAG TPA: glycosyltransferase family 4 protein [Pyrinomonadaceae bacterium]|nr:glycosyltransferase family 4 protein [Pyrinomonadaceae bacterium]
MTSDPSWVCCQLGAREHYAVPRALQRSNLLHELITDLWIRPGSVLRSLRSSLAGRFHPSLSSANVTGMNLGALGFELGANVRRMTDWTLITRRNDWFQRSVVNELSAHPTNLTVFAYSYAAEGIFKVARERGWRTVLGQIDPGPAEERIVAKLSSSHGNGWRPAPAEYWKRWRNECDLADRIVVNSTWSREALLSEGMAAEKIHVVPVAFESPSQSFNRTYPAAFSSERPMRVLFLGQINLRKGATQLFDAIKRLSGEPIEFWFVGSAQVDLPKEAKWFGVAPRNGVSRYYRDADVFILPTHSDGFGLTQLEAQSWKLPVVASRFCGDVVRDGHNGLLLDEVSGDAIAATLRELLRSPESLHAMSKNSHVDERFSLTSLAASLSNL